MKPRIAITVGPDDLERGNTRRAYCAAVERAGGEPHLVSKLASGFSAGSIAQFDGILFPGGDDVDPSLYGGRPHGAVRFAHPERDALELEAVRNAKRCGLPTLAICRGMQVVNVALGGTLYEDIADQYERPNGLKLRHQQMPDFSRKETTHDVDLRAGSKLATILGAAAIRTNSLHHQAVRRIAYDLEPVAHARDGIVEALELRGDHPFFVAVQWHPEELVDNDEPSRTLFSAFVEAAARRARGRLSSPAAR
jgi:putative glutamine amidotransferase